MRDALRGAQTLKTLWVTQHLAPLFGQGDDLPCHLVLSGHPDLKDLLGFLARGKTAESRQTKGDASRILDLAHPVLLGHSEQRCNGISTDWQAHVIPAECLGGLQLERKRGAKLLASSPGGHDVDERLTLGQGVVRAPVGFEHLLAGKES